MSNIKSLVAKAYVYSRPNSYQLQFGGRRVTFLTDSAYTKNWYYRNRLRGAARGYHEPALTLFLERISSTKKSLLDVGAHLGYFSILFASVPGNNSLAVELDPSNYRELCRAIDFQPQQIKTRIKAMNVGISDESAAIELPQTRPLNSSHRIELSPSQLTESVSVDLVTIGQLLRQTSFVPDLVKIDIEGFEVHGLRGTEELLGRERPLLLIEVHPSGLMQVGGSVQELLSITGAAGYKHFRFLEHRAARGSPLTDQIQLACDTNWDLVCVHSSDEDGLAAVGAFLA